MLNFAITGVAGYIAPRHLQAIRDTGNTLLAAADPNDSVGILDRYFPQASYFREYERFDRHLDRLHRGRAEERVHWVSICSPNHLHDAHVRQALRVGASAICEKPLVLNPWNLDALEELERECGGRVHTVLQLRLHPAIRDLRARIAVRRQEGHRFDVELTYVTSRGLWYDYSWKGDPSRSGGIGTNIGVHFFDAVLWLFGRVRRSALHLSEPRRMAGYLELENADVRWFLSIDRADLPAEGGAGTINRSMLVDGEDVPFSEGFTDLHTQVYRETVAGRGFTIDDARPSIELVHALRCADAHPAGDHATFHPRTRSILQ